MENLSVPVSSKGMKEYAHEQSHEHEIITELMNKYADNVIRMCYVYLKDYHLAEDVTQKTFMRVMKHYVKFRKASSEKTWIMQIAINLCKNHFRSSWYKRVRYDNVPEMPYDADYDGGFDRQEVFSQISKLKPKYKEVILLYYYQEMSIAEIAEVLRLKESSVKVRLFRAREQLKLSFKGDGLYE